MDKRVPHIEVILRITHPAPRDIAKKYGVPFTEVARTRLFRVLEMVKPGSFGMEDSTFLNDMIEHGVIDTWNQETVIEDDEED